MSTAKIASSNFVMFTLLLVAMLATGCNDGPTGPPKFPTKGVLTNGGKPVADAQVVFHSVELRMARAAVTGPDGHFTVKAGTGNGLPAGTYQVVVRASPIGETEEEMVDFERSDIPKIYWVKKTSPLELTIEKSDNLLEIDLSK